MRRTKTWLVTGVGLAVFVPALLLAAATAGADWPRYRGPKGDGISKETGLLKAWPAAGPKVLWRARLGSGYSGMAVAGGRLFTMFGTGGSEYAVAFDAASGKELWRTRLDRDRPDDMGGGPRATPAVDGGLVYVMGAEAKLAALEAASGKVRWQVDLKSQHGARIPDWGASSSPVIEGDVLLVTGGGSNGRALLGLHKTSGKLVWAAESDVAGYSTPLVADLAGTRQALFFAGTSLISVSPQTGKRYWSVPWRTSYDVNAAMPVLVPPDKIFISSSYDTGGQLLRVVNKGGQLAAEPVWKNRVMKNHFNSSVYVAGHLYGFDDATLKCIVPQSAAECWKQRGFGKGSLLVADGHLWVLSDDGVLALVEVAPGAYREKARAQVLQGKTWTMPTLAGKRLYVRSERELVALDVAG